MAYDGLVAIQKTMGATVDNQETKTTQIRDAMRSYAQKHYDLVFGHGFEYNQPAVDVAKDFPDTVFVTSSGGGTAKNVGAFRFYLEQGFYLCGMMGALMSKTGRIGSVAVGGIPSINSTLDAYEAGAKAANPHIVVKKVFFQNEGDVAAAKQGTEQLAAQGVDFVIHQANAAAQGVFDAAKEKGIYAFGANLNQNDNSSGAVIASAYIDAVPAFLDLAKQVKDRTFVGKIYLMGMDKGAIKFAVNPDLKSKVPADVQAKLDKAEGEIVSGKLVVPKAEF